MKIGIITPMAEEKGALIDALVNPATVTDAGMTFTEGRYGNHDVIVTESGIGKVAAAVATTVLITRYDPDLIVNTGSAGALNPNLAIGDEVVGTRIAHHDADVTVFGYDHGQLPGQPTYFESSADVVAAFAALSPAIKRGLIVSGDQFVQDAQKQTIEQHFPEADLAEMEAAAVAQAATQFKKPFIVLRGVSDLANGDSGIAFEEYVVEAGRRSAKLLLTYLDHCAD